MSKQVVTEQPKQKETIDFEGFLFYFLLISVIALLPLGSAYWLLSVA